MTSSQTSNKQKQPKEYCNAKGGSIVWRANLGVSVNYILAPIATAHLYYARYSLGTCVPRVTVHQERVHSNVNKATKYMVLATAAVT